jgi:pyrimidine oxygenase
VLKRLWTEEKVTHHGAFFHLEDCVSMPKPQRKPYPYIVSAGVSDEGLRFAATHSDYAFIGLRPEENAKVRAMAAALGREVKVCTNVFILQRDTDAEAEHEFAMIREQLDVEALDNLIASFNRDGRPSYEMRTEYLKNPSTVGFGSGTPIVGSPETVARKIADMCIEGGADGLQFTFVDFVEGLRKLGDEVLPILRDLLQREDIHIGTRSLTAA